MKAPSVTQFVVVALALAVIAGAMAFARRFRDEHRRRPVLLGALLLASLVPLYAAAVQIGLLEETWVRLTRPAASLVLPASLAVLAARLYQEPGRRARIRTALSDLFFGALALALGLVVTGLELGRPLDRLTVLVVIDKSRSIELVPGAAAQIERELALAQKGMREDDLIATVSFGTTAATEQPPRKKDEPLTAQEAVLSRDGTDLDAAIRRALAEVPSDSAARIVLISDGVATRGDVMGGAAAALGAQVPVDVIALEQQAVDDVRVVAVRGPARGDAGEDADLRVVTRAPRETEVELRVKRDGQLIRKGTVKLAKGEDVLRVREKLPDAGLHRYDVEVTPLDATTDYSPEDNAGSAFIRVRGRASVLLIEGDAGKGRFVAEALRKADFLVDEVGGAGVPADLGGFAAYDLVILSDVAASTLAPSQIDALAFYTRDLGGGLWLMGGDRGMGPGGYSKTPIEEVSPVSFDLKQDQRRGSLAEVIGIDISGSMGARVGAKTKLELANEAASRSAELLGPGDHLGVAHVDTEVHWTVKLAPVGDFASVDKAIRSMPVGGGGIIVPITLEEGYAALRADPVNIKHLLLLADGDDAEQMAPAKPLTAAAKTDNITTSVVALGQGHDVADLEELSRLGGGRFYLIEDASRLPAVFAQETILAARSALVEDPFKVQLANPGQAASGIDFDAAPELGGYVVTLPKPRATIHLLGPEGDPILATWAVGVGKAGAFTSDLKDRWGTAWTHWPGAARMVAQTARELSRRAEDDRVRLEADASGGQLAVRATVVGDDGRAQSFRRIKVKVAGPGGFLRELPLEPTSAGAYAASLPLDRPGTYVVVGRDEVNGDVVGATGAVLSSGEELRPTGTDHALLARVADFTGGKTRTTLDHVFDDRASRRFAHKDASPQLLFASALLLLFAVAARKLGIPEGFVDWWHKRGEKREPVAQAAARPAPGSATLAALKGAKAGALPRPGGSQVARVDAGVGAEDGDVRSEQKSPVSPPDPAPPVRRMRVTGLHPIAQAPKPAPPPPAAAKPPTAPAAPPSPGATHGPGSTKKPLSSAELLLARRKGKS